jgi:hypothetical protein
MAVVLALLGAVALLAVSWCALHVRREVLRRRQAAHVRAALEPRATVAGPGERCGADEVPRCSSPTATGTAVDHAVTVPVGPHAGAAGASR